MDEIPDFKIAQVHKKSNRRRGKGWSPFNWGEGSSGSSAVSDGGNALEAAAGTSGETGVGGWTIETGVAAGAKSGSFLAKLAASGLLKALIPLTAIGVGAGSLILNHMGGSEAPKGGRSVFSGMAGSHAGASAGASNLPGESLYLPNSLEKVKAGFNNEKPAQQQAAPQKAASAAQGPAASPNNPADAMAQAMAAAGAANAGGARSGGGGNFASMGGLKDLGNDGSGNNPHAANASADTAKAQKNGDLTGAMGTLREGVTSSGARSASAKTSARGFVGKQLESAQKFGVLAQQGTDASAAKDNGLAFDGSVPTGNDLGGKGDGSGSQLQGTSDGPTVISSRRGGGNGQCIPWPACELNQNNTNNIPTDPCTLNPSGPGCGQTNVSPWQYLIKEAKMELITIMLLLIALAFHAFMAKASGWFGISEVALAHICEALLIGLSARLIWIGALLKSSWGQQAQGNMLVILGSVVLVQAALAWIDPSSPTRAAPAFEAGVGPIANFIIGAFAGVEGMGHLD